MIDMSEIITGETFNHKIAPEEIVILEYMDDYINHTQYEYTTYSPTNFCQIISPTKELGFTLFEVDELVDLITLYYQTLIAHGDLNTVKSNTYIMFIDEYPELMV